ncbi:phosphorothioated DNA-binding restriction endonuclease [Streptomyces litchfieldiae]|uniref:phosphorothioated DNA-binding restriction endonuclease n=1 Tax=Streptomyces litchfieldiae TaxID=3075543 RepID=UPI00374E1B73
MTREELLTALATLRRARVRGRRAPHKPLLLLWLLGRFASQGSTAMTYAAAEEPVSRLINDFGPPVRALGAAARQRAAMPFVHLERTLWDLRDAVGEPLGPGTDESGPRLRALGAHGRLRPAVESLLADTGTLAAAARVLLDQHFTPALEGPVCEAAGLDLTDLEAATHELLTERRERRRRQSGFADTVLRAYAYACAMCGFDGRLGRNPVGLEAAHIRWHSQDGPDEVRNALALCSLHHTLFDLGALGVTGARTVRVSGLYVAGSPAGRAVGELAGRPLAVPQPGRPGPAEEFIAWHDAEVFKADVSAA